MRGERRRHGRYRLWLPARLLLDGEELVAVGHDMSRRGARLVTDSFVEVQAAVTLVVRIPPQGGPEMSVPSRVVRCAPNHEDPTGLWRFELALSFLREAPAIEARLRELVDDNRDR